jgi:hypothetical protein
MKVTVGKWFGFLELAHGEDGDEVRVTIPVQVGAFRSVREAFNVLRHDFSMWPREDDINVAVELPEPVGQLKKTESKRTMRYVS